jgi:hypothetical protein
MAMFDLEILVGARTFQSAATHDVKRSLLDRASPRTLNIAADWKVRAPTRKPLKATILAVSMQLKNHEWTLMNTNLRTRTMIQPFAPQSLNDGRESRRKGTPILWFHWCLFVFIGGLTASFRLSEDGPELLLRRRPAASDELPRNSNDP